MKGTAKVTITVDQFERFLYLTDGFLNPWSAMDTWRDNGEEKLAREIHEFLKLFGLTRPGAVSRGSIDADETQRQYERFVAKQRSERQRRS